MDHHATALQSHNTARLLQMLSGTWAKKGSYLKWEAVKNTSQSLHGLKALFLFFNMIPSFNWYYLPHMVIFGLENGVFCDFYLSMLILQLDFAVSPGNQAILLFLFISIGHTGPLFKEMIFFCWFTDLNFFFHCSLIPADVSITLLSCCIYFILTRVWLDMEFYHSFNSIAWLIYIPSEDVSSRHTHSGLTWMSHCENNSEITVSILLPLHGELVRMISWIAHSKLTVWDVNSWSTHSKVTVWAHLGSLLWGRWVASKWACREFSCEIAVC